MCLACVCLYVIKRMYFFKYLRVLCVHLGPMGTFECKCIFRCLYLIIIIIKFIRDERGDGCFLKNLKANHTTTVNVNKTLKAVVQTR